LSREQVVLLAAAALTVFWMVGAYNRLVALRNTIVAAWLPVAEELQRRGEAVAALVAVLRVPMAAEQGALETLLLAQAQVSVAAQALGTRPMQADLAAALVAAEAALAASASRVLALQEQHAELRHDPAAALPVAAWRDCAPRLVFRRQVYNKACADYNDAVNMLPTRWLARLYRFSPAGRL
jgi:LemA protein